MTLPTTPIERAQDLLLLNEQGVLVPPADYAACIRELLDALVEKELKQI